MIWSTTAGRLEVLQHQSGKKEAHHEKDPGLASVYRDRDRDPRDSLGGIIRFLEGEKIEKEQLIVGQVVGEVIGEDILFEKIIEEALRRSHRFAQTLADSVAHASASGLKTQLQLAPAVTGR